MWNGLTIIAQLHKIRSVRKKGKTPIFLFFSPFFFVCREGREAFCNPLSPIFDSITHSGQAFFFSVFVFLFLFPSFLPFLFRLAGPASVHLSGYPDLYKAFGEKGRGKEKAARTAWVPSHMQERTQTCDSFAKTSLVQAAVQWNGFASPLSRPHPIHIHLVHTIGTIKYKHK